MITKCISSYILRENPMAIEAILSLTDKAQRIESLRKTDEPKS